MLLFRLVFGLLLLSGVLCFELGFFAVVLLERLVRML